MKPLFIPLRREHFEAFKRGDSKRLTQLLPKARGHVLEPWAAYWELRARLDQASESQVRDFLTRYAHSYQEDRLRNDWLLLLGSRRDWTTLAQEHPHYRMRDDREVQCYVGLVEFLTQGPKARATISVVARENHYDLAHFDTMALAPFRELLGDVPSASAILDRFLHHAEIITIEGDSYRRRAAEVTRKAPRPKPTS